MNSCYIFKRLLVLAWFLTVWTEQITYFTWPYGTSWVWNDEKYIFTRCEWPDPACNPSPPFAREPHPPIKMRPHPNTSNKCSPSHVLRPLAQRQPALSQHSPPTKTLLPCAEAVPTPLQIPLPLQDLRDGASPTPKPLTCWTGCACCWSRIRAAGPIPSPGSRPAWGPAVPKAWSSAPNFAPGRNARNWPNDR